MVGSARLAERRLATLFQEFRATRLLAAIEAMLDATERRTRAVVAAWRDGVYQGHATLDDDGHGREDIVIRARVTKSGSDLTVDLTASDPQSTSFVNSSHANMQSAVAMALAYLIDADIPKNDGAFRVLRVVASPGTVVWANEGAPVTLCTSHCANEIVEAIITALATHVRIGPWRDGGVVSASRSPAPTRARTGNSSGIFPCAARRGRIAGRRWMAERRRVAFGRRHQVRQRRGRRSALSAALRPARVRDPTPAAPDSIAAERARSSSSSSKRRKSRSRIRRETACATAHGVSLAATTASLTLTCFVERAGGRRAAHQRGRHTSFRPGTCWFIPAAAAVGAIRRGAAPAQHAADRLSGLVADTTDRA